MTPGARLLETRGLVKAYRRRRVVDGVSISVDAGEIVGLLGPNGAGKTTSFRITAGMIAADEGKVFLRGQDVTRLPMFKRARLGMGYLSQEPSVFRRLSVKDNILAVLEARRFPRARRSARLDELLAELELTRLADHLADTLSGGERRRLEITRALATEPGLILLDEPFSGVDPIAVQEIQAILNKLVAAGIGILLTDHNVYETLKITRRAYIIHEGKVLAAGVPAELIGNAEVRRTYLGESFTSRVDGGAPAS
jgi:lipopolysaccharide export system ATP-binding protein